MKMVDYHKLMSEHKPVGHISADANTVANTLIRDMNLQAGYGLARFLEVECCFDNYMALRVWVQKKLNEHKDYMIDDISCQLRRELYELFPNSSGY